MSKVVVFPGPDHGLESHLHLHKGVIVDSESVVPGLRFHQGQWKREVRVGDPALEVAGLIESMDNNPLVCADAVSVPDPASTLALIALVPLIRGGLILEAPTMLLTFDPIELGSSQGLIEQFLAKEGLQTGITLAYETQDLGSVLAASAMCLIETPKRIEDIDELYEEAYSRSFFVRRSEDTFLPENVNGTPLALYSLRISGDDERSILTIRVLADRYGKCGAAQIVHAMNIMAGFEESLGILN